jgi:hypothetical protein
MYDNQTSEDGLPPEPTDKEVNDWVSGNGAEMVVEAWKDALLDGHRYVDLVEYIENHMDDIVDMYIESYNPPEPPDYTRKELEL